VDVQPALGIDLGGTKLLGMVVDGVGAVGRTDRVPTPKGSDAIVAAIADMISRLDPSGECATVGIGIPGLVDRSGYLCFAPNLPGVRDLNIIDALGRCLGQERRIAAENDATCAGVGEQTYGAAAGHRDVLMVTLGTGIGGGIVADGQVVRGANGFSGEIGHMVIDPHGPRCPCGKRGCWERYASGSGLGRLAREAAHAGSAPGVVQLAGGDPEGVRGEHVTKAAQAGDPGALAIFAEFGHWLALGLANLAEILDPDIIVLGGGLIEAGEVLMGPARQSYQQMVQGGADRPVAAIVAASLGELAGGIGAAVVGRTRTQPASG
jgi:glucokinase